MGNKVMILNTNPLDFCIRSKSIVKSEYEKVPCYYVQYIYHTSYLCWVKIMNNYHLYRITNKIHCNFVKNIYKKTP